MSKQLLRGKKKVSGKYEKPAKIGNDVTAS